MKTYSPATPRLKKQSGTPQMLTGSILISFSAVFVKLSHIGPTMSGFYRLLFGAGFLCVIVLIKRDSVWKGWGPFGWAFLAGVLFAADIFFWHRSIVYIGPGLATIIGNFQVFFLAAVGLLVFKERVTWRLVVSIPLAVTGLFLLVGIEWSRLDTQYKLGAVYGLLTAVMYAGYLLTLRRSQRDEVRLTPLTNLAVVSAVTAVILAAVGRLEGKSFAIVDRQTWVVLVSYGILCQALGWIVITWGLTRVEASRAGLLLLLQPTLTFVWDILFFKRPTTVVEACGALLALGAIYLGGTRRH
jgi:drug/metabolite transporter (DMT)-like permease